MFFENTSLLESYGIRDFKDIITRIIDDYHNMLQTFQNYIASNPGDDVDFYDFCKSIGLKIKLTRDGSTPIPYVEYRKYKYNGKFIYIGYVVEDTMFGGQTIFQSGRDSATIIINIKQIDSTKDLYNILSHELRHEEDKRNKWVNVINSKELNQLVFTTGIMDQSSPYHVLAYYGDPTEINAYAHSMSEAMSDMVYTLMVWFGGEQPVTQSNAFLEYIASNEITEMDEMLKRPKTFEWMGETYNNDCNFPNILLCVIVTIASDYLDLYAATKTADAFKDYMVPMIEKQHPMASLVLYHLMSSYYYDDKSNENERRNMYEYVGEKMDNGQDGGEAVSDYLKEEDVLERLRRPLRSKLFRTMKNLVSLGYNLISDMPNEISDATGKSMKLAGLARRHAMENDN